ncbi:MAG: hypothetical protein IT451_04990 [Candidatus Brocadia sp.]|nr:hypothetical protein [Candidatus Brocadia sp.]
MRNQIYWVLVDEYIVGFDRHARRRMKWRRISEEETTLALENLDKIEDSM